MSNFLLDISNKITAKTKEIVLLFHEVAVELNIDYVIVGATARDLIMEYAYGVHIDRATYDVDFAIRIGSWEDFESVKSKLLERGFTPSEKMHRLNYTEGSYIDLVPFGPIENPPNTVKLPPQGEMVMNTLGFAEAKETAVSVLVSKDPDVVVPVVSPEGFTLLKLIAWTDRDADWRERDRLDIEYMLSAYHEVDEVSDLYYSQIELVEEFGGDVELAGALLLGQAVRSICKLQTEDFVRELLERRTNGLFMQPDDFMEDEEMDRTSLLYYAFQDGFEEGWWRFREISE